MMIYNAVIVSLDWTIQKYMATHQGVQNILASRQMFCRPKDVRNTSQNENAVIFGGGRLNFDFKVLGDEILRPKIQTA